MLGSFQIVAWFLKQVLKTIFILASNNNSFLKLTWILLKLPWEFRYHKIGVLTKLSQNFGGGFHNTPLPLYLHSRVTLSFILTLILTIHTIQTVRNCFILFHTITNCSPINCRKLLWTVGTVCTVTPTHSKWST